MITSIKEYCDSLIIQFDEISSERRVVLEKIAEYVKLKITEKNQVQMIYICTHNSRRSHFGQIWAKVAGIYYNLKEIETYSGGTEATAFNENAINALKKVGFEIEKLGEEKNARYQVYFDLKSDPILCYSKVYNEQGNPQQNFAAIMTCSDAEENCPFIPGAELRISTTYNDPKNFDNTPQQDKQYDERCRQIALESLYIFPKV